MGSGRRQSVPVILLGLLCVLLLAGLLVLGLKCEVITHDYTPPPESLMTSLKPCIQMGVLDKNISQLRQCVAGGRFKQAHLS